MSNAVLPPRASTWTIGSYPAAARGTLAATGAAPEQSLRGAAALVMLGGALVAMRRHLAADR